MQVLLAHSARMRAEQPAIPERYRPVTGLQVGVFAPLLLGPHDHVERSLVEAALVVARQPIRGHARRLPPVRRRSASACSHRCFLPAPGAPSPASAATGTSSFARTFAPRTPRRSARKGRVVRAPGAPEPRAACAANSTPSCRSRSPGCAANPSPRCPCGARRSRIPPGTTLQRFARLLKHRARRQARLVTTVGTFEQEAIALGPHAGGLAARAGRLAIPSRLHPVRSAVFLAQRSSNSVAVLGKSRHSVMGMLGGMLGHGPSPCCGSCYMQIPGIKCIGLVLDCVCNALKS